MSDGSLVSQPQQSDVGRSARAALMSPRLFPGLLSSRHPPPDEVTKTQDACVPLHRAGGASLAASAGAQHVPPEPPAMLSGPLLRLGMCLLASFPLLRAEPPERLFPGPCDPLRLWGWWQRSQATMVTKMGQVRESGAPLWLRKPP